MSNPAICSVSGCTNSSFTKGINFFYFPRNPVLASKWAAFTNSEYILSFLVENKKCSRSWKICGSHFQDTDFTDKDKMTLRRGSLPSIFCPEKPAIKAAVVNSECENRWINIHKFMRKRRKEERNKKLPTGSTPEKKIRPWRLEEQHLFLTYVDCDKMSLTNAKIQNAINSESQQIKLKEELDELENEETNISDDIPDSSINECHSEEQGKEGKETVETNEETNTSDDIPDSSINECHSEKQGEEGKEIVETNEEIDTSDDIPDSNINECHSEEQGEEGKETDVESSKRKHTSKKSIHDIVVHLKNNDDDRAKVFPTVLVEGQQEEQHPVDAFFQSIATSVKKMSHKNQIRAKMEISQIIRQLELDEIFNHSSSAPPSTSSVSNDR